MQATVEATIGVGPRRIIERPRLTRLLDDTSARTIMLIAPAGYGKTTLARQWLENRPHAWCQGGVASSDVAALALGIAEAAGTLLPHVGRRLREWLPTSRGPENEVGVIERFLSEDLAEWPDETWFVIDDYQFLSSAASEDLVRRLFGSGQRRLLLTSRERPRWASARDLLYGNIFELSQSALAMNVDEANEVLASTKAEAASGLVALADGWPAVIGLAALMPHAISFEESLPAELHDYLAEELFASLPGETQERLAGLALLPVATRDAAQALLGDVGDDVMGIAQDAGLFIPQRGQDRAFHPLLRSFLRAKLRGLPAERREEMIARAIAFLIAGESWEEAFSVIKTYGKPELLDQLLAKALEPLTDEGRLTTLVEWLDFAREHSQPSPYLSLLDAELAFREGLYDRAGVLAASSAAELPTTEPLRSLAYYRLGQARHFLSRPQEAMTAFGRARATALKGEHVQNAIWGQFLAAFDLENNEERRLLSEFASLSASDPKVLVRTATGEAGIGLRIGNLSRALSAAAGVQDLVSDVRDPLIRSGFWQTSAAGQVLAGQYSAALQSVDAALAEVDRSQITFARPHALVLAAASEMGLRRFTNAEATLTEVERRLTGSDDYLRALIEMMRFRMYLYIGQARQALLSISDVWSQHVLPSLRAEFLATKAAALASINEPEAALDLCRDAEKLSSWLEPRLLCRWVRVLVSAKLGSEDMGEQARAVCRETFQEGGADALIFAQRVHPPLLRVLACDETIRPHLAAALQRANDHARARQYGVLQASPGAATGGLTARELEVYAMLGEGQSNRQIAQALYISEGTAKVHVRNILKKLGLRTRTEVAIHALTTRQRAADADADRSTSRTHLDHLA